MVKTPVCLNNNLWGHGGAVGLAKGLQLRYCALGDKMGKTVR